MWKIFSKSKKNNDHDIFIESVEGLACILHYQAENKTQNSYTKIYLERLENIANDLFELKNTSIEKFERLTISKEFWDLYETDKEEAQLRLSMYPEHYLTGFNSLINTFIRVNEISVEKGNSEISRNSIYHLINILSKLSSFKNNELFIRQILQWLYKVSVKAIEKSDPSMYASTVHWYSDVVFNHLSKDQKFDLQYLALFNDYLFISIKTIIQHNNRKLFDALISTIVDGIHIPTYDRGKIYDLQPILFQNNAEILIELSNQLIQSQEKIYTQKELENWLNIFDDFTKNIKEIIDLPEHEEVDSIIREANNYTVSMFKYNRLVDVINGMAAYLLFKNKPNLLFEIWEAKQPGDAGGTYGGNDLFPTDLVDAVKLFFRRNLHEYQIDFWDGHHGSETYYLQYMVLVFMRILTKSPKNEEGRPTELVNFNLPKEFTPVRLSSLEHTIERLRNTATRLKEDPNLLSGLKFDITETDTLINDILNSFFDKLEEQAKKQLKVSEQEKEIAPKKVEEFKKQVFDCYQKENTIHQLFVDSKCFVEKLSTVNGDIKLRFGFNRIDKKAAFFDEWHTSFVDWGVSYGRNLAVSENRNLFDKIANNCEEHLFTKIETVFNSMDDISNTLIVSPVDFLFENLKNNEKFEFVWGDRGNLKGLRGYYHFRNEKIPVYEIHYLGKNGVLVLDKKNMGKLIQYSPLSDKDTEKDRYDDSMLVMKVVAFSEDNNLLNEFLDNPPHWLKEKKDPEGLLKEHVLVQIFEKFEFIPGENFVGNRLMVE